MKRVWLILNRASRTVSEDWEAVLTAAFVARGAEVVGTTDFPHQALPTPDELEAMQTDVAAVAAGDGTINAVAAALDDWAGALLVLPGGTMNMLAKALHGDASPAAIIAAVADPLVGKPLPTIDAGTHRAIVGAILGPGATWVHTREAVRHGRWGKLRRAVRLAASSSLSRSIRLAGPRGRSAGYRAIFVSPGVAELSLVKVSAAGWKDGVRLGFSYLTGSWESARGIATEQTPRVALAETRPTFALFDGEPVRLQPGAVLEAGMTRLKFVTTL